MTTVMEPAPEQPEDVGLEILDGKVWKGDLPSMRPEWAADLATVKAHAQIRAYRAGHISAYFAIRSPIYAVRVACRALLGTGRGVAALTRWLSHTESRPYRAKAAMDMDVKAYVLLKGMRRDDVRVRGIVTGVTAGGFTAAGLAQWFMVSHWFLALEGLALLGIAAYHGTDEDDEPIVNLPELPQQLDLNVEDINRAFRAVGLLKGDNDDEDAPRLVMVRRPMYDQVSRAWSCIARMPEGSGKTATQVIKQREALAAELGVEMIQLELSRVRGTTAGTFELTRFDTDPYLREALQRSPLEDAEKWSIWDAVPFGLDARGNRIYLPLIWENTFFGGLPRRGKTGAQRIAAAGAVLDWACRIWCMDAKGGSDWKAIKEVAHRYITGAEPADIAAFEAMLDEAIAEIEAAYKVLAMVPEEMAPDAKITPKAVSLYPELRPNLLIIDELQEILGAISDRRRRDDVVERIARIMRRGPAVGWFVKLASQRPDAESVPTKLRDIASQRYCTQVPDQVSSDMVCGKKKASQGADASILSEEHKGVGVLVLGPVNHVTVMVDYMDLLAFREVCKRGRHLRLINGALTGDAADEVKSGQHEDVMPLVLADVLDVMREVDRMHTTTLMNHLVKMSDHYDTFTPAQLAEELERAGVTRSTRQVKVDGENRNGWYLSDLKAAAARYGRRAA